jgi:hypothetical protein
VTNGQLAVGFYANAAADSYLFIDDLSLELISADPELPAYGEDVNGAINIGLAGDTVTADFSIATNDASTTPLMIIATYDERGRLVALVEETLRSSGGSVLKGSLSVRDYNPKYSYSAFLWDSETYVPLTKKATLSIVSIDSIQVFPYATDGYTLPDMSTCVLTTPQTAQPKCLSYGTKIRAFSPKSANM